MVSIDTLSSAGTITLGTATEQIQTKSAATPAGRFTKTLIIENLSLTNNMYVSFKVSASAETEEYTFTPGSILNLNFSRSGAKDVWIRGTVGDKFSFIAI